MEQLDRLYKERHLEIQDGFDWSDAIEAAWPGISAVLKAADVLAAAVGELGTFKEAVLSGKVTCDDGDIGERILLRELRVGDAYRAYCKAKGDEQGFECPYKVEVMHGK